MMKLKLYFAWLEISTWFQCRWLDIKYANDETWLAIALVTTWVACAYIASVN